MSESATETDLGETAKADDRPDIEVVPGQPMTNSAEPEPTYTHDKHHHRDVQGGAARAAVFGISDGLVSNVALILAIAGAGSGSAAVRLAGLAGLLAGAISMAAGEYVSMRAQTELLERELQMERLEIHRNPERERHELEQIYVAKGVEPELARAIADAMHSDLERAVEAHAREELGIDPESLGSANGAAISSFVAFGVGAVIPLAPWFFAEGTAAILATVILGSITAIAVGLALASFTGRSWIRSSLRQWGIAAFAAAITYGLGNLVGAGGLA